MFTTNFQIIHHWRKGEKFQTLSFNPRSPMMYLQLSQSKIQRF